MYPVNKSRTLAGELHAMRTDDVKREMNVISHNINQNYLCENNLSFVSLHYFQGYINFNRV